MNAPTHPPPPPSSKWLAPCCLLLALAAGYFAGLHGFKSSAAHTAFSAPAKGQSPAPAALPPKDKPASKNRPAKSPADELTVIQTLEQLATLSAFYEGTHNPLAGLSLAEAQAGLRYLDTKKPTGNQVWHHRLLRSALYAAWAAHDLPAALAAARHQLTDRETQQQCLAAILGLLAETDPAGALNQALSLSPDPSAQNAFFISIFKAWSESDPHAALAYVLKHPELPQLHNGASAVFEKLALESPRLALDAALQLPPGQLRGNQIRPQLMNWAEQDPDAALQWTLQLTDPVFRDEMLQSMAAATSGKGQAALDLISKIESPDKRDEALSSYYSSLSHRDAAAAMDFLLSLGDASLQKKLLTTSSHTLQNASDAKQNQFLAQLPSGELREAMLQALAPACISQGRFPQAVRLLNEMADSPNRDYGLHRLGFDWRARDVKAADTWLKAQPPSTDRDIVLAGFAVHLVQKDPEEALRRIAAIADPGVRRTAHLNSFHRWYKRDAAAATAWLASNHFFTPQEKEKMLSDGPRRGQAFDTPVAQNAH